MNPRCEAFDRRVTEHTGRPLLAFVPNILTGRRPEKIRNMRADFSVDKEANCDIIA